MKMHMLSALCPLSDEQAAVALARVSMVPVLVYTTRCRRIAKQKGNTVQKV